ncbi:hypothetical protein CEE37_09515 [candidate division LCP-89 bacterium B3_LCP]|uniref:Cytochrome c-552/4 domain-containing protein n=1 Tax=candidate division LCP-89 bacterium B3_LCP TaxID=2012998 RepID=A0A532UYB3_UNCL8|nr:MAG: hypothetical protein CEE37_09515 [candidate division LCP-89 bacterium B3_LCP]
MMNRSILSIAVLLLLMGCQRSSPDPSLVIWVTADLEAEWLPRGKPGDAKHGGLLRTARALELYRQPDDILVDLGNFRHLKGTDGSQRTWRIHADGFLKAMARMNYTAINASRSDVMPWPPEFAANANEHDLPATSCYIGVDEPLIVSSIEHTQTYGRIIRIIAFSGYAWPPSRSKINIPDQPEFTILITDTDKESLTQFLSQFVDVSLVIWRNEGEPIVAVMNDVLVLGTGSAGSNLGRIELSDIDEGIENLQSCDLSGWLDRKPQEHHPLRQRILSRWAFWRKKPHLRAFLWAVPEYVSPHKETSLQMQQTDELLRQLSDLKDLHRETPNAYAGSELCLQCHDLTHKDDLAQKHLSTYSRALRNYPVYERCLGCHSTGFDDPGGFILPWERPDLLQVSCEACHGAGYDHAVKSELLNMPLPTPETCNKCHLPENLPSDHDLYASNPDWTE